MKRFLALLQLDALLVNRYQIISLSVVVTALYAGLFYALNENWESFPKIVLLCVFSDPAVLGYMFLGALILFEKTDNNLAALAVSPLRPAQYLWSKNLVLTLVALVFSYALMFVAYGWNFNYGYFGLGIVLASLFFTFVGFISVSFFDTFNKYILGAVFFIMVMNLALLNFLELTDDWLIFYLLPSQGVLILLEASVEAMPAWKIAYALISLPIWITAAYFMAKKTFTQRYFYPS